MHEGATAIEVVRRGDRGGVLVLVIPYQRFERVGRRTTNVLKLSAEKVGGSISDGRMQRIRCVNGGEATGKGGRDGHVA